MSKILRFFCFKADAVQFCSQYSFYHLLKGVYRFASTRPLIKGLEAAGARCSAHMKKMSGIPYGTMEKM